MVLKVPHQNYQFLKMRFDENNLLKNHNYYMVSKGVVATICANVSTIL
jgi:hypothetical protein